MKVYIFSCNAHPGTKGVSTSPDGNNLPERHCEGGQWMPSGHLDLTGVGRETMVPGIDLQALRNDIEEKGWHVFDGSTDDSAFNISYV